MNPPDFDHKDSRYYRFPRQCPSAPYEPQPYLLPRKSVSRLEDIFDAALIAVLLVGIGFAAGWTFCKIYGG
jgi:hypothetical protein